MTPEIADALIDLLLDGWEQCLHNADSLWQAGQGFPGFDLRRQNALADPFRQQATREHFAAMRIAVADLRAGVPENEAAQRLLETMRKIQ